MIEGKLASLQGKRVVAEQLPPPAAQNRHVDLIGAGDLFQLVAGRDQLRRHAMAGRPLP